MTEEGLKTEERKQMEEVLRESEERYRRQFEEALDAIFVADAETGIIIDCNRAATELVGKEKSELVGKHQRILHPPEEIDGEFSRTFKRHLKEKEGQVLETQVITKNGEIKDVAIKANVFEFRGKKLIQGIFRDISERKKIEKALREAEEKYRKTILNANVGIIAYDPEGEVKVLNPKMEEMIGFKRTEIPTLVKWFEKLYPNEEERRKVRDKWFKRMSEEGEVKEGHAIITTKEGKHRNFLFNGVQLESGDSIAFAHDITERKKAEEKLRKSEKSWSDSFNSLEDVMIIIGKDYTIKRVNDSGLTLLGKTREEVVGKKCYQVVHGLDGPGEFCPLKRALKTGKLEMVDRYEKLFDKHFNIKSSPIFNERGEIVRFVDLMRDITDRKKTEEALRESEEKYRELINGMNDTAWVIGFDGKFIDVNEAAVKVLGYSREELLSMGPPDIDNTLTAEQIRDLIKRMPTDEIQVFETTHTTKDRKTIPVEISSSLVTYKGKQAILSIARDITKRKKVEEALRRSEEEAKRLLEFQNKVIDTAVVWVNLLDLKGNVILWNRAAELVSGYSREEVIGHKKMWEWLYPDPNYRANIFAMGKEISERGKRLEDFHSIIRCKDGSLKTISWYSTNVLDEKGKPAGSIAVGIDVTERKKMEKKLQEYAEHLEEMVEKRTRELRESEEKLEDVFKTIPDSIVILDLSGNLFDFNESTLGLFGYSREEIIKKKFLDFIVEEDLERVLGSMKQVLEKGFARIQFQISAKDERKIPVELNASVLKDQEGNRVGFVVVLRDITERKKMEEQLLKSERLAAIGQLATMVGHDLRNPLSAIQNACYYLKMKMGASKDAKVKKMFEVMDKEVDYANNITKDLLDLSRVKKPEFKELDLISSIQDALAQLKFPENIALTTKFSEVPAIEADPNQLRRVLQNIALNGAQAMPDGGELIVSTRKNGDFVEVAFTDTGVGISRENMDKLFTPLFTTKAQGIGLGLAICKDLVEGHNGRIEVKSKVGEGSTFTIKLPVDQIKGGENQT